jgi:D-amino peptidase
MRIYILADMEGISGIRVPEQVGAPTRGPEYEHARGLMMADINAAVAGCVEGGAGEVLVCDTHGGGGQLLLDHMDKRAQYEMPARGRMMPSLGESFTGLILLGHHARAGTLNGFLDHTMSSAAWFEYRINGQMLGEIGIEAAYAGHYGVPVIMVSGDAATATESRELLGEMPCAVVKQGLERMRARCVQPAVAQDMIRATAIEATAGAREKRFKPFRPALPATVELTYNRSDFADEAAEQPGVQRIDARMVRKTITSLLELPVF